MRWVLLRGLTREAGHWGEFPQRLARATGEPVLAPDLPGNGRLHAGRSPASVPALAEHCMRRLACDERTIVVAMSLGAMVAVEWMRRAPEGFAGAALINTSLSVASPFWHRLQPRSYPAIARLLLPGLAPLARERLILWLTTARPGAHERLPAEWAHLAQARPVRRSNALRQFWAAARYRGPGQPPPVPLLLLASAGDVLVSPRCSQALSRRWGLPLRLHPWAGHDLSVDDPDWLLHVLLQWRASLGG